MEAVDANMAASAELTFCRDTSRVVCFHFTEACGRGGEGGEGGEGRVEREERGGEGREGEGGEGGEGREGEGRGRGGVDKREKVLSR